MHCVTAKKHIAYRLFKRKEREEDEIQRVLNQKLWEEQNKVRNLEKKRIKAIDETFQLWKKYEEMKRFLDEARYFSDKDETNNQKTEWINWAEKHIESSNPFPDGLPKLLRMNDLSEWELTSMY